MPDPMADRFVAAARIAADLVLDAEVARRWDDESACAGMSVGGLAHHLAAQAGNAARLTTAAPVDEAPIELLEHYRRAAWVRAGPDDEVNVGIRVAADDEAAGGYDALARQVAADLEALPVALDAALDGSRTPGTVHIPWQGWSLTTHDFLVTRLMEIVVHSDDLAASLEVPTPRFPDAVVRDVLGLLTGVAVERHGQTAVVRALSRPQRAPGSVSAF